MKIRVDHKYSITYNTDGEYNCADHGCNDEGICRCYRIDNVEITYVNLNSITNNIFDDLFDINSTEYKRDVKINTLLGDTDITKYAINRLLVINKLYDINNWVVDWGGGYYGDEIDSITIEKDCLRNLLSDIDKLLSLYTLKDRVEFLLKREYGSLLPKLIGKEYTVETVLKTDIIFGQTKHYDNVNTNIMRYYLDSEYGIDIKGVCLFDGEKYRVIDGYHRLKSTNKTKFKIIIIF